MGRTGWAQSIFAELANGWEEILRGRMTIASCLAPFWGRDLKLDYFFRILEPDASLCGNWTAATTHSSIRNEGQFLR